jgi:hypothetical protein
MTIFLLEFLKMFLGLPFFVRYGPNALPKFEDNFALKLSYVLDLGF